MFQVALLVAVACGTTRAEAAPPAGPVVLFAKGWAGPGSDRTLLVPVVCYTPGAGLVSAATSNCLSLVTKDARVSLDSGTVVTAAGREPAVCVDEDGKPNGPPRESLAVSGDPPSTFEYAVWPASAGPLVRSVKHSPPDSRPSHAPASELRDLGRLIGRHARGELEVLQRLETDLDGDGQPDVAYSVDVRCTEKEMKALAGPRGAEGEPWSCFNGLLVRWGGSSTFAIVAEDWELGQIGAVFDLDGDRRPEVLVFAPLDEGSRVQVFTVDKRKLKPLEPWCCGCPTDKKRSDRPTAGRGGPAEP